MNTRRILHGAFDMNKLKNLFDRYWDFVKSKHIKHEVFVFLLLVFYIVFVSSQV